MCSGGVVTFESDSECDDGNDGIVGVTRLELELSAMLVLQNELFMLVCTLFLGRIGFLIQNTFSQTSQQGKEGLEKGICTNSGVVPSKCVHVGWVGVEVASPQEEERATLAIFGLATNLSLFFLECFCILCCVL